MLIRVEYADGERHLVRPHQLNRLLSYDLIERFERSEGWVSVRDAALRGPRGSLEYDGPERRAVPFS